MSLIVVCTINRCVLLIFVTYEYQYLLSIEHTKYEVVNWNREPVAAYRLPVRQ